MFKIVKDGIVIDILEVPLYVFYQKRNRMLISTTYEYAQGVVSSDGSVVWALNDELINNIEGIEKVSIVEITDEEAAELKAILEANEQELIEQLQEELGVEEVPEEQILPRVPLMELQAKYELLAKRLEALEEENRRLREQVLMIQP